MPIHDQGYRRYAGTKLPRGRAWAVIAAAGLRLVLQRREFIALLLIAWLPFLVRTVQFYAAANFPQMSFLVPTAETFRRFLDQQGVFVFFVTVYVGAGLIANDRRANALPIYLSKPLTREEYIFGKLAVLMTPLLFVTWIPALLLLVVQVSFAGSFEFMSEHIYLLPAITLFSFVEAIVAAASMLALSALSNNSRFVGVVYAALVFFSDALFGVVRAVTGESRLSWLSLNNNLAQVGDLLFRLPLRYSTPWAVSLLALVGLMALSAWVLERRVRGVEVVA